VQQLTAVPRSFAQRERSEKRRLEREARQQKDADVRASMLHTV
jgi:hypothetical protein